MSSRDENIYGGNWSVRKLDCVEDYVVSYLRVMQKQKWATLCYIDAFSGDGIQRFKSQADDAQQTLGFYGEEMNEFTEGSALRAVKVSSENEARGKRGFNYFFFLELSPVKLEALKKRIGDRFPDQLDRCRFIVGDVNESLPKLLEDISWTAMRGVAFIDPFATQLNWSSIEAFRKTHCDVWMLFPLGDIIRMLPRQHLPLPEWEQPLTRVLGDEGWKTLYTTSEARQLSLFGDESAYHTRQGTQEVINYISERLRTVFAGVWGPAELRTSNNAPLFALYSMIPEGSKIAIDHSRKIASHLIRGLG